MSNESIIITGAASGIGHHMANSMIQKGYRVLLCDINEEKLKSDFTESDTVIIKRLDVTDIDNWKSVINTAYSRFGAIDYLFNIAGIIIPGFIHNTSIEELSAQIDINTKGVIYGAKLVSDIMVSQKKGHIINVASLAGIVPATGIAAYCASKFAVRGFSLAIAGDLKPHNVFVTVICPDLVDTPMLDNELHYEDEAALIFTGSSPLTTIDIEKAFLSVMRKPKLELALPYKRSLLAKIGGLLPNFNAYMSEKLKVKGKQKLIATRESKKK